MKKNKVVIVFLVKFFAVYFSLTGLYALYLNNFQQKDSIFACAPITNVVSNQAKGICKFLGYDIFTEQNPNELSISFFVNEKLVSKIVEGCTSISIMILFLSFIIAFSGRTKTTILFGISGLILIYAVNIFRIVLLTLAIYHYPKYSPFLHNIVFPGIIYGMVFTLWVVWVNKFALINRKT